MNDYPKILYVEDDPVSRMVLEFLLKDQMQLSNVTIFESSENFKKRIDGLAFNPDVVLLDIHVQPLDGFQMLGILREHPSYHAVPIVALTASVMSNEVEQLRDVGFNSLLAKPIEESTFADQLYRVLNREQIWAIN